MSAGRCRRVPLFATAQTMSGRSRVKTVKRRVNTAMMQTDASEDVPLGSTSIGADPARPVSEAGAGAYAEIVRLVDQPIAGSLTLSMFLDEQLYGNLLHIDARYIARKRVRMATIMRSICADIEYVVNECVSAEESRRPGYKLLLDETRVLNGWSSILERRPSEWPSTELYLFILRLDRALDLVDHEAGKALSENHADRWAKCDGDAHQGAFIPSEPQYRFERQYWASAFPHLASLVPSVKSVLHELSTPAYAWQISLRNGINALIRQGNAESTGLGDLMYRYLSREASNCYLGALGVMNFRFTAARLISGIGQIGDAHTACKSLDYVLSRSESRGVFSEETIREFDEIKRQLLPVAAASGRGAASEETTRSTIDPGPAPVSEE